MAILWIKRVGGDALSQAGVAEGTARLEFLAKSNRPDEPLINFINDRRTPPYGSRHPENPLLFAVGVDPRRRREKYVVDITVHYSTEPPVEKAENPLQRPAAITVESEEGPIHTLLDAENKAITNTAGDLVGPQEDEIGRFILNVQKNVPPILPKWLLQYPNAVNGDAVRIRNLVFPKETLRMRRLRIPDVAFENGVHFVPLSFELHYQPEGWHFFYLNRGFNELKKVRNPKTGRLIDTLVPIRADKPGSGEAVTEPQFLDADGRAFRADLVDSNGNVVPGPDGKAAPGKLIPMGKLNPRQIITLKRPKGRRLPFSALPLK